MTDSTEGTAPLTQTAESVEPGVLAESVTRLCEEFDGLHDASTVDRMVGSSHEQLAAITAAPDALAILAERFARERLLALAKADGRVTDSALAVLFLCTHNAGRSQMALGFFHHLAGDQAAAWSGGSTPDTVVNPLVVQAMTERGVDISTEFPKPWTDELMRAADVVVDMGCGDDGPILSGHRYEQWPLPDPADQDIDEIRVIRDDIEHRVRRLITDLGLTSPEPDTTE